MSPERKSYEISLDEIIFNSKEIMLSDGNLVPMLIIEGTKNVVAGTISDMPPTHGERLELMRFLGQAAAKTGRVDQLQQVFMASEGWLSIPSEDKPLGMRPSQDPNRKEALIISGIQIKERKKHLKAFEILRDNDKKVIGFSELFPDKEKNETVEIPLLEAFVQGFQLAFQIRAN